MGSNFLLSSRGNPTSQHSEADEVSASKTQLSKRDYEEIRDQVSLLSKKEGAKDHGKAPSLSEYSHRT